MTTTDFASTPPCSSTLPTPLVQSLALQLLVVSIGQPEQSSLPELEQLESQHSQTEPKLEIRPPTSTQPLKTSSSIQTPLPQVVPAYSTITHSQHKIIKPNPKYALITMPSLDTPCNPYNIRFALAHPGWKVVILD